MDLRTAHPRDAPFRLERRDEIRCLRLAGLGFGAVLLARIVHVRIGVLVRVHHFLVVLTASSDHLSPARQLIGEELSAKEKRAAEPSA